MTTDAQSNLPKDYRKFGDHESHDTHGETHPMLLAQAAAQTNHPKIASLSHRGLHYTHP
jgi:hypothetical protein